MTADTRVCVQARFDDQMIEQIEAWRRAQPRIPLLSAAIRALVVAGLKAAASGAGK
ncbi:hypothetical protein ACVW1A_006961 [Bradyrhizobium sp. LB1.3]